MHPGNFISPLSSRINVYSADVMSTHTVLFPELAGSLYQETVSD